jgi:hypothetical protein
MKHFRHVVLFAGAAIVVMQFLPFRRISNPAVIPGHTIEASFDMPKPVEAILNKACKNCHSYETQMPWYGRIAPVSWMIHDDIARARQAMNLSEWSARAGSRPAVAMGTLLAACGGVEAQKMPPASYRRMHPEARLTTAEVDTLCGWTAAEARLLHKQAAPHRTLAQNR